MWKPFSYILGPLFSDNCGGLASWKCSSTSVSCWWAISIFGRKGRSTGTPQPLAGTALRDGYTRLRAKSDGRENTFLENRSHWRRGFLSRGVDVARASRTPVPARRISGRRFGPCIHIPLRSNGRGPLSDRASVRAELSFAFDIPEGGDTPPGSAGGRISRDRIGCARLAHGQLARTRDLRFVRRPF